MEARDLTLDEIHVGDSVSVSRVWTEEDVSTFAALSGDKNPLHMDSVYAEATPFKHRLVHGMLLGSLCSQVVGMYLPGKRCLYLSQSLVFKNPVFIGDTIEVTGVVTSKSDSTRIVTLSIIMKKNESVVVEGEAKTQVL